MSPFGVRGQVGFMGSIMIAGCLAAYGAVNERFTFELERPPSQFGSLLSFFVSSFLSGFSQGPAASVPERSRPALARSRAS